MKLFLVAVLLLSVNAFASSKFKAPGQGMSGATDRRICGNGYLLTNPNLEVVTSSCVTGVEPGSMGAFCYGEVSTSQPYACTGGSHGTLYINYHNASMPCGGPRCLAASELESEGPAPVLSMEVSSKEGK